ncbi:hypothetical protein EBU95_08965, partial [bacterium]|nr:hypothetical protein [bacterium]
QPFFQGPGYVLGQPNYYMPFGQPISFDQRQLSDSRLSQIERLLHDQMLRNASLELEIRRLKYALPRVIQPEGVMLHSSGAANSLMEVEKQGSTDLPQLSSSQISSVQAPTAESSVQGLAASEQPTQPERQDRATHKPVVQKMSPEELEALVKDGATDQQLLEMGIDQDDIDTARLNVIEDLIIAQHEQQQQLEALQQEAAIRKLQEAQDQEELEQRRLQEAQDEKLALVLQEEEDRRAQRGAQTEVGTAQQSASEDEDEPEDQQTASLAKTPLTKSEKKRQQKKRSKERKKEEQEKADREAAEKAKKEAERIAAEKAQQAAQATLDLKNASAKAARERLEELRFAQGLTAQEVDQHEPASAFSVSADSQELQKETREAQRANDLLVSEEAKKRAKKEADREKREAKALEKAEKRAAEEKAELQKSLKAQIEKEIGSDLYGKIMGKEELTPRMVDILFKMLKKESEGNENFSRRLWAAVRLIENPYSSLFKKPQYATTKRKAIQEAISFVQRAVDYDGIKAAINYYLESKPKLTDVDKEELKALMRQAKEDCLLPDDPQEEAQRNAEVADLEKKVQEKLKPQTAKEVLEALKTMEKPKTPAELVYEDFAEGIKAESGRLLCDTEEGRRLLEKDSNLKDLITKLHRWKVSLGALITTHVKSGELQKKHYLVDVTSYYTMLFHLAVIVAGNKKLPVDSLKQFNDTFEFLSKTFPMIENEPSFFINSEMKGKLDYVRYMINEVGVQLGLVPHSFKVTLKAFEADLQAVQDLIYDDTKIVFPPEERALYIGKLEQWLVPLNQIFEISHTTLKPDDFLAQFSQFYASFTWLEKMINAASDRDELERLKALAEAFSILFEKAQHLQEFVGFNEARDSLQDLKAVISQKMADDASASQKK